MLKPDWTGLSLQQLMLKPDWTALSLQQLMLEPDWTGQEEFHLQIMSNITIFDRIAFCISQALIM